MAARCPTAQLHGGDCIVMAASRGTPRPCDLGATRGAFASSVAASRHRAGAAAGVLEGQKPGDATAGSGGD